MEENVALDATAPLWAVVVLAFRGEVWAVVVLTFRGLPRLIIISKKTKKVNIV
jgi:hypothetical protein